MKAYSKGRLFAVVLGGVVFTGLALLSASTEGRAGGNENCEPSRWLGAFGTAGPGGPGMMRRRGRGMGMGRGMGRGRGRGMGMGRGMRGAAGNVVRHRFARTQGVPAPYAGMTNPLPATEENLKAGKRLYEENCASCHGPTGRGDGEAGKELSPKPANLADLAGRPVATDGLLMWAISEGGEKLKTDMPAFGEVLSEKDRWRLIAYLRAGLRG